MNSPINHRALRRARNRAASTFDASAILHREVGNRLLDRLDYIKLTPHTVCNAACATGVYCTGASGSRPRAPDSWLGPLFREPPVIESVPSRP